jgi:transposase
MLLKGAGLRRPPGVGKGWTRAYREWLDGLCNARGSLQYGQALAMESMLRELDWLEGELAVQDQNVETLSQGERYAQPVEELRKLKGVGVLTAMVFLTEMGDLSRFSNRRKVGAYLGLVPSSQETGEDCDRKGHITRQGSWRVRKVLCQAAWSRLRSDALTQAVYRRLAARNPKKKKIALVAMMRRLAVRMWHVGRAAQQRAHCFPESECVGVT